MNGTKGLRKWYKGCEELKTTIFKKSLETERIE
jgi:hypothetical protein